ncbi:MAG: STAS domain-containing protein [Rhodobacteraceae bacterium]|nr:STAS domain-containing protein [Paracoccaceae bacterium]
MSVDEERLDLSDVRWIDRPELLVERLLSDADHPVTADCSRLGAPPALLIQTLVAARRTSRARGGRITLGGMTPAFREAVHLLGLHDEVLEDDG